MSHTWDPRLLGVLALPHLLPVETIHTNPWFVVRKRGGHYTMETHEAHVAILPVVGRGEIAMVRVLRPLINDATWELPAGGFNPDQETPEEGVRRELAEETGIWVDDLDRFQPLPPLAIIPNRTPSLIFPFRIGLTKAEFDNRRSHDHEISEVLCFSFKQLVQMIQNGEIYVAMPVAMISRWLFDEGKITYT